MVTSSTGHERRLAYRTCPLCEATCGLELLIDGARVVRVRGDRDDVYSHGFLCPKGASLGHLHTDPDRLRRPRLRDGSGWRDVSWPEAFAFIDGRLRPIIDRHGRDAVALYFGNPSSHSMALNVYTSALATAVGSRHVYSANTVDSVSRMVAAGMMFGTPYSLAVPDIDRCSYLLILGANPAESNGSLWTVPDVRGRIEGLQARGGTVVVVDPRRTRTAALANEHIALRPGGDAALLAGMVHTLFDENLARVGLREHVEGIDAVRAAVAPFSPERVAARCGVDSAVIRRLARDLAAAPAAAVYGRMGTTVQRFGTVASWFVDVLNVLTDNLDRPGGVMFARPVAGSPNMWGTPGRGRGLPTDPVTSRVHGYPRVLGEFPVATLADEIREAGDGQVRALVTVAGNPVISTPDSASLDAALGELDLLVSVDFYLNETSRRAHVVLPPPSPLERAHFDSLLYRMAIRHVANYSPAVFAPASGARAEWQILSALALIAAGRPFSDVDALDDELAADLAARALRGPGLDQLALGAHEVLAAVAPRTGPERIVDLLVRSGPYGDWFGHRPDGLSLAVLEDHPHGVDMGPLEPRIPEVLRTPSGKVELAPPSILADLVHVEADLASADDTMVLIGRRDVRSNNSWMHNVPTLMKGSERCTLLMHPTDAAERGLTNGQTATIRSRVGTIAAPVEITADIRPGVVSLPHGWGHDLPGVELNVAAERPGVNLNVLTDATQIDPLSGNSVLNGIPVTVEAR